jgi:hypothetical protein
MKHCLVLLAVFALGLGGGYFAEHSLHHDVAGCTRCAVACDCGDDCSCCAHCVCEHRK